MLEGITDYNDVTAILFFDGSDEDICEIPGGGKLSLDYNAALDSEWWECKCLAGPVSSWPISDYSYSHTDEAVLMKAVYKPKLCVPQIQSNNITAQTASQPSTEFLFQLMEKFSSFTKVANCLAYLLLFSGK